MIAGTAEQKGKERCKVLVVDDEPQILHSISDLLEDDFDVVTETDGEAALERLRHERVAVIISDQRMPRLNGHEFLRRASDRSRAVRLLITGYADLEALIKAVNQGRIYGYIAKPWEPEGLRTLVGKAAEVFTLLQELDHERHLLRALMDNIPDPIYFKDTGSRYTRVNPAQARILGVADPQQALGRTAADFLGDLAARSEEEERRLFGTGEAVVGRVEHVPDGERWLSTTRVPIRDARGEITGLVGISRDITAHKRAEERALLDLALQQLRNAVLEMSGPADWAEVMSVFQRQLQRFAASDGCSVSLVDLDRGRCDGYAYFDGQVRHMTADAVPAPVDRALRTGTAVYRRDADEMRKAGDDGLLARGLQSVIDVPFQGGTLGLSSRQPRAFDEADVDILLQFAQVLSEANRRLQDLSTLERKEQELRQAQKMEAVGQLAGGVAHDFNNLVTVITGYSQFMLRDFADGDPHRAGAEQIYRAGHQAHALIRQLLAFSRRQVMEPEVLDINRVVADMQKMLGRLIGEDVGLTNRLAPDIGRVRADPGQLEQIVMNLVINARDAMPDGGQVTVETADEQVGDDLVRRHSFIVPGQYVRLTVRDTGIGMDENTRARIFEPFFTTKEAGKGTGLGLSTVYGIVKQNDGFILVDSAPGAGAAFHVYLPRYQGHEQAPRRHDPDGVAAGRGETVLLVEDDAMVRQVSSRMLRDRGFNVLEAGDGETCLERFALTAEPIDLLVTDVVLPGINGCVLAERLRQRRPDLGVLYVSGFADHDVVRREVLERRQPFLQKPFTIDALAAKVRAAIDRRPLAGDSP